MHQVHQVFWQHNQHDKILGNTHTKKTPRTKRTTSRRNRNFPWRGKEGPLSTHINNNNNNAFPLMLYIFNDRFYKISFHLQSLAEEKQCWQHWDFTRWSWNKLRNWSWDTCTLSLINQVLYFCEDIWILRYYSFLCCNRKKTTFYTNKCITYSCFWEHM